MNLSQEKNKYSIIAGICFFIITVRIILSHLVFSADLTFFGLLYGLVFLGFTILLLTGNAIVDEKTGLLGFTGVWALLYSLEIFPIIYSHDLEDPIKKYLLLSKFLLALSVISLFIILLLAYEENVRVRSLWFIPSLLWLGHELHYFYYFSFSKDSLGSIPWILGVFFIGLSLRKDSKSYGKTNNNLIKSGVGGADMLLIYKELLDSGAITEEEFKIKKEEILNL